MSHSPSLSRSQADTPQHDVFLSYSRADEAIMQRVKADLEAEGLRIWIDQTEIEPGTPSWMRAIQDAIDNSLCFLVIFSPTAKVSNWVEAEMSYAKAQKKRMFYILAFGDESTAIPFGYTNVQWVDIRDKAKYAQGMRRLILTICKHLGVESLSQQREREQLAAEQEAKRLAEKQKRERLLQEARRKAVEEEEHRRIAEIEAQRRADEEARLKAEADLMFKQAVDAFRAKQWDEARTLLIQSVRRYEYNEQAWLLLSGLTNSLEERQSYLKTALDINPSNQLTRKLLEGVNQSIATRESDRRKATWNPVNWLHLLWWIFIIPERYSVYKSNAGESAVQKIRVLLANTLLWLSLFIPALGLSLGVLPASADPLGVPFGIWNIIILLVAGVSIFLDFLTPDELVGTIYVNGVVGGVVGILAFNTPISMKCGIVFWGGYGLAIGAVIGVGTLLKRVEKNIDKGRFPWWGKFVFAALALSYTALIWISFFGGYKFFENL